MAEQRFFSSYEAAQEHYDGIRQEICTLAKTTVTKQNAAFITKRATELLQETLNWPDKEQGDSLRKVCADLNLAAHMIGLDGIDVGQA